ncbi:hypothetical protein HOLleu_23309 [Holothuria leucospilota]|uniref:EGF-like domain-containing protein n=1 Tax=Holothuria leucospilota TaxID=206669 RepID=A0A9Q1BUZ8_HOLLE|nr:hypothetical protein HOLleu_23309 [Holothuria leucospilota]
MLSCNDYQCDTNALCDNRNGIFECRCKDGYRGDGVTCTRLTDCTDVYNAGLVEDSVYKILPTGWTEKAFEVYCKERWNVRSILFPIDRKKP